MKCSITALSTPAGDEIDLTKGVATTAVDICETRLCLSDEECDPTD